MTQIKPFQAYRPRPDLASRIACLPYDVVNRDEAQTLADGEPYSFLRVVRSEIELGDQVDPYSEAVYDRAKENLLKFIHEGALIPEASPCLYIYRLEREGRSQSGVVGCFSLDDYEAGIIKIHEKTRPEKEADRVRHITTTGAQTGLVFLAYRRNELLQSLIRQESAKEPIYDFVAADRVRHTVWRAEKIREIEEAFSQIPHIYIADGHHRAASAARVRQAMQDQFGQREDAPYNLLLGVAFAHDELTILPYNRIIYRLPDGYDRAKVLNELSRHFAISESSKKSPVERGSFCMYLKGQWYLLKVKEDLLKPQDPMDALDVSVLYDLALNPIFKIADPRTDKNIDFVGGVRGPEELERLVDSGTAECAFSVYPVSIEELFHAADQNQTMAPKSTWFEPKLRSGLFVHQLKQLTER